MGKEALVFIILLSCADICGNLGYDSWFRLPKDKKNCYCVDRFNRDGSFELLFNLRWLPPFKEQDEQTDDRPSINYDEGLL